MTPALRAAIDQAVADARPGLPDGATLLGVGWATVDTERVARDLGVEVVDAGLDAALGARCATTDADAGTRLVLLEPSTEGRLSFYLARRGEGFAATWWAIGATTGLPVLAAMAGPFGVVRLVGDGRRDGPWRFLRAGAPATITP